MNLHMLTIFLPIGVVSQCSASQRRIRIVASHTLHLLVVCLFQLSASFNSLLLIKGSVHKTLCGTKSRL
jgi:hypothetical protein